MKKLKFMLAAATAIGLASASQAASYPGSTDFENFTVGANVNSTLNQYFDFTGEVAEENESVIAETETYTPTSPVLYYRNSAHAKHLKVSTGTDPLLRKVNASAEGADVTENDVYIDTLVQFTVTPSTDTVTAGAADKLMIYLKEDVLDAQTGTTETNLMVKAAYYVPADQVLLNPERLEPRDVKVGTAIPGAWYRLTVKASVIKDTNQDDLLVFNIWLDGAQLANPTSALYGEDLTLFPSLLGKKASSDVSTKTSLAAVGFAGEGCVDDIAFTTDYPFATVLDFTLTLDANVSAVNLTIGDREYSVSAGGKFNATPGSTITIGQIEYAEGYMAGGTTVTDLTLADGSYTVSGDAPAMTIAAAALPTVTTDGTATSTYANGVYTFTVPAGYLMVLTVNGEPIAVPAGTTTYTWDAVSGATVTVNAQQLVAQVVGGDSYTSLKAAVDAAQAGDTVEVLANCTVASSVSFTKNITFSNDYTIAANVNYALCVGATVSFVGSGKIERASNITGSAICVGANETTRGTIGAGTAGTLTFDGLTVCGGKGGNLIKLEYGTVNMNGGILKDGLRGIKADADVGSYTSAIVINGGTITNCSGAAVLASAQSANGTATVTIKGGDIYGDCVASVSNGTTTVTISGGNITGALSKNTETDGTGTVQLTIPGLVNGVANAAKFDRDQSAFCADGYETTLDNGWYVVTEKQQTGWVDDSSTITAGTTAAAQYPALADTALAEADAKALTDWAKANSVAFIDATADAASYVEAYLLNCAPVAATVEAEKAAFKANITVNADGSITVTPPAGKTYNGTLQLKGATSLTAPITWTDVEAASSSYQFYKYELSL